MASANKELDQYLELTPKSRALWEEAKAYLPGGDSRHSIFWDPYPIFVDQASGCHVVDADGVDRLDFINTMTTLVLGHRPTPVMDAVRDQLDKGVVYNAPNRHQVRLAKILCERIPSFDLVRFTNSGTEATLNTIRAARAFTGKNRFAKVEGGYHGTHDAVTVSIRVDPRVAGEPDEPTPVAGSAGLADDVLDQVTVLPFNEPAAARKILEDNKNQLAAVIVEPLMGSVGMVPGTHEFLDSWFLFLVDPTIPATNHRAEQALKTPIVNRKVWGGNRTDAGGQTQAITCSVLQTCKNKAINAFTFLSNAFRGVLGNLFT